VAGDDINLAGLKIEIEHGRCVLSSLEGRTTSQCRKIGGLHVLRELPLCFDTIRQTIRNDTAALRGELARHFHVRAHDLSRILLLGEDDGLLPTTLTKGMVTATLFTGTVDGHATGPVPTDLQAPSEVATSALVTKTPVRELKMTFGYPSSSTIAKLAKIIEQPLDYHGDQHLSDVNMQANAKKVTYRPIGELNKAAFRAAGKTIVVDFLGEKHVRSIGGYRYCLTTMDAYTHLVDFQVLKSKASLETWQRFKSSIMALNLPVDCVGEHLNQDTTIHVDGGSSFAAHMGNALHHGGMRQYVASAESKDTNLSHMVEFKNMQIQHKVRVWMAQCNTLWRSLGKTVFKWWPAFVKQGALVMNHQPTTWHDGRPAIEFKPGRTVGKVTKAEIRRMFPAPPGALCWCIYTQAKRDSMRSVAKRDEWWPTNHGGIKQWVRRSDKCVYLYTMDDGRYRVLNVRTGKVWQTLNVKFSFEGLDTGYSAVQSPGDNIEDNDWQSLKSKIRTEDWRPNYDYSTFDWDDEDEDEFVTVGPQSPPPQAPGPVVPAQPVQGTPATTAPTTAQPAPTAATSAQPVPATGTTAQQLFNNAADPTTGTPAGDQPPPEPPPRRSGRGHTSSRARDATHVMTSGVRLPPSVTLKASEGGESTFFYDTGEECENVLQQDEPTTLTEALKTDLSAEWLASWERELGAVSKHLTKVRLKDWCRDNPGERPLHSTIVIKIKRTPDGKIDVFKSRLCCIGTNAKPEFVGETSSQTPNRSTIDMFTALGVQLDWKTSASDAVGCFLQGEFFSGQKGKQVLRLPKSVRECDTDGFELAYRIDRPMCGLKDSSANWTRTQAEFFTSAACPIPLRQSNFDAAVHSLYLPRDKTKRRRAVLQLEKFGISEDDVVHGRQVYHIAS
jgi:hypothetical protein